MALQWLPAIAALLAGLAAAASARNLQPHLAAGRVPVWILAFALLAVAEFGVAGPYSFSRHWGEMNFALPVWLMLLGHPAGDMWHQFAGGIDPTATISFVGARVHYGSLLLSIEPLWLGVFAGKLLVASLAVGGLYLLCRRGAGLDAGLALAVAMPLAIASPRLILWSANHGLGFALIPLMIHVTVFRTGRPHYAALCLLAGGAYAISCTPTNSAVSLFNGLILATVLFRPRQWVSVALAASALAAMILLNWGESLWAKMLMAPLSSRQPVAAAEVAAIYLGDTFTSFYPLMALGVGLTGVILAFAAGSAGRWRLLAGWIAAPLSPLLYLAIPWPALGLAPLAGINWGEAGDVLGTIEAFVFAVGTRSAIEAGRGQAIRRHLWTLGLGLGCATLTYGKAINLIDWLGIGGLRNVTAGIETLRRYPGLQDPTYRTLTLGYRTSCNITAAAGVPTFDGATNIVPRAVDIFWEEGLLRDQRPGLEKCITPDRIGWDMMAEALDFDRQIDLRYLALAGIRHVITRLPLKSSGLTLVHGDPAAGNPLRSGTGLAKLAALARYNFEPPPLLVYELAAPLPRVYGAGRIVDLPPDTPDRQWLDQAAAGIEGRLAVVRGAGPALAALAGQALDPPAVEAVRYLANRIEVDVLAPRGGVLLVGTPFLPFWHASVDGAPAPSAAANVIQTAVTVPPGGRRVVLDYRRPPPPWAIDLAPRGAAAPR